MTGILSARVLLFHDSTPFTVRLVYSTEDPWAVRIEFRNPSGTVEPWVVARQQISRGLARFCEPVCGDVRIFMQSPLVLRLVLDSEDGHIEFFGPMPPWKRFLDATKELVAYGSETADWDSFIAACLTEEAA